MSSVASAAPVSATAPSAAPVADTGGTQATGSASVVSAEATAAAAEVAVPASLKIGGKTYSEAELQAAVNASSALEARLQELSTRESAFQEGLKQIKDPAKRRAFLKANDVDYVQEAEDVLMEHLREQELTPEQRELAELKAFKAERERESADVKAREEAEKVAQQTAALTEAYEAQFIEAMSAAQLPRTPRVAMELLDIVQDCLARDIEITPKEAALILKGRVTEANRPVYEGMSVEQLQAALGPKVVDALIKAHTAGLQAATAKAPDSRARMSKPKPKQTDDDRSFWDNITKIR